MTRLTRVNHAHTAALGATHFLHKSFEGCRLPPPARRLCVHRQVTAVVAFHRQLCMLRHACSSPPAAIHKAVVTHCAHAANAHEKSPQRAALIAAPPQCLPKGPASLRAAQQQPLLLRPRLSIHLHQEFLRRLPIIWPILPLPSRPPHLRILKR